LDKKKFKGIIWCDFKFSFSLKCIQVCIDKIPEAAKTKVSKPKRYSLSKLRLVHALLKRLIQTRPHMFTSRCGKIFKTPPKCIHKERRQNYYSRCSNVAAAGAMSWRCCVSLWKRKYFVWASKRGHNYKSVVKLYLQHCSRTVQSKY